MNFQFFYYHINLPVCYRSIFKLLILSCFNVDHVSKNLIPCFLGFLLECSFKLSHFICVCAFVCHGIHVEVKGQLTGLSLNSVGTRNRT